MSHFFDRLKVIALVYLQNLARDFLIFIPTLPHLCKPTVAPWGLLWVVAPCSDLQRCWNEGSEAANHV